MPKPVEEMDPKTRDEVWRVAGSITWTVEDWKTFYWKVTEAFAIIAFRRAREMISKKPEKYERIIVDGAEGR